MGLPIGLLSPDSVRNYSDNQLEASESESLAALSELFLCRQINYETKEILARLCDRQGIDLSLSKRKWLIFALKAQMNQLPPDSLYGPLKLNDFWSEWGEDQEGPNIIQGVDNLLTPGEFYTDENYKSIVRNHNSWLESEFEKLTA